MTVTVRIAGANDADVLARIHAQCFARSWSAGEIATLLDQRGVHAWVRCAENEVVGFILVRAVIDEAEILTIAVAPDRRRAGLGRALLDHALDHLQQTKVVTCFLEVASDNEAALRLYRNCRFDVCGERSGYYARSANAHTERIDAITMKRIFAA